MSSGAVVNLISPRGSSSVGALPSSRDGASNRNSSSGGGGGSTGRSRPRAAAAAAASSNSTKNNTRYILSLVPIQSTFDKTSLHKMANFSVAPTIKRVEEPAPAADKTAAAYAATVTLGRNMNTGIEADYVSRQLVDIRLQSNHVPATSSAAGSTVTSTQRLPPTILLSMPRVGLGKNNQQVYLNGVWLNLEKNETRELRAGDVLALCKDKFKYTVHLDLYQPELDVVELLGDDDEDEGDDDDNGAAAASSSAADHRHEPDAANDTKVKAPSQPEAKPPPQSPSNPLAAQARSEIVNDSTCPTCFEILVKTKVAHPCGHSFCSDCAAKYGLDKSSTAVAVEDDEEKPQYQSSQHNYTGSASEEFHSAKEQHSESSSLKDICPNCRVTVTSIAPSKTLDNMVWNNVLQGTYFPADDVMEYLRRTGRTLTEKEAKHIFRRDPKCLSEYLSTLTAASSTGSSVAAVSVVDDLRPRKKSRSEEAVGDKGDRKPSANNELGKNNDNDKSAAKGNGGSVEFIDVDSSHDEVICID